MNSLMNQHLKRSFKAGSLEFLSDKNVQDSLQKNR